MIPNWLPTMSLLRPKSPSLIYLKYNIDGASKGNPRKTGYGGVLRDAEGGIIFIFHCHLGTATNNMAELMALEQCLDFLSQDNYFNVMIEAEFELIINSVKKKNSGTTPEKVSKHWKLIRVFQRIQGHLQGLCTVSFHHVRRKVNKLADLLANQSVNYTDDKVSMKWQDLCPRRLKAQEDRKCSDTKPWKLAQNDLSSVCVISIL